MDPICDDCQQPDEAGTGRAITDPAGEVIGQCERAPGVEPEDFEGAVPAQQSLVRDGDPCVLDRSDLAI